MTFGKNFLPGPTGIRPELLAALGTPVFAHYSSRMADLLKEIQPHLQDMFGTNQPVFTVSASGSGMIEAAVRSAVPSRLLATVGGFFGEHFARIAERCGREVVRINVPIGKTVEAEQLEVLLDGPPVDAVSIVHSETSTGALTPLEEIAEVMQRHPNILFLVDAVSSAAGARIDMDRLGIDFVATGSQKAMGLPPGLSFGAASQRLLQKAESIPDRGFYFNATRLTELAKEYRAFETPALSLYFALIEQLRSIAASSGWESRWERHRALANRLAQWVGTQPNLEFLASEGRRSPTVSVLVVKPPFEASVIAAALESQGFLVGQAIAGIGGNVLRIGHMGDLEMEHLDRLIEALEPLIN